MSATLVARRSGYLRSLWRTAISGNSISRPSVLRARTALPCSPSRLRRESIFLNSLLPVRSAIASACLVSKLPNELSTSTEGRFTNYVSPI